VDRAVDYAYQTTHKFPDRRIFLVGEIIHNPHVNRGCATPASRSSTRTRPASSTSRASRRDDVVIMPAFGVTMTTSSG
jgi:4-hydroxy-3-methylbut-2-en-1-yl diphosphate reductase